MKIYIKNGGKHAHSISKDRIFREKKLEGHERLKYVENLRIKGKISKGSIDKKGKGIKGIERGRDGGGRVKSTFCNVFKYCNMMDNTYMTTHSHIHTHTHTHKT